MDGSALGTVSLGLHPGSRNCPDEDHPKLKSAKQTVGSSAIEIELKRMKSKYTGLLA
jgi:hypothetical protein